MQRSENIDALASALSKAQAVIKGAPKDHVNPHFKSRYADLASAVDASRDALASNGLCVSQHPAADGAKVDLTTYLMHSSGQWMASTLTMTAQQNTPQAIGSAITYARRYAHMAIIGIAPDDDDGEQASKVCRVPALPAQAGPILYNNGTTNHQNRVIQAAAAVGVTSLEQARLIGDRLQAKKIHLDAVDAEVKKVWEDMQS